MKYATGADIERWLEGAPREERAWEIYPGSKVTVHIVLPPDERHFLRPMQALPDAIRCLVYVFTKRTPFPSLVLADIPIEEFNSLPERDTPF